MSYFQKRNIEHSEPVFKSRGEGLEKITNLNQSLILVLYGVPDLLGDSTYNIYNTYNTHNKCDTYNTYSTYNTYNTHNAYITYATYNT